MLVGDEHFRKLYHSFIIVKSKEDAISQEQFFKISTIDFDSLEDELHNIPVENDVNSLLLYPYIDHTAGMSFLVVATAFLEDNRAIIYNRDSFEVMSTIRKDKLNDKEFVYANDCYVNEDFDLDSHMEYVTEISRGYCKNANVEAFRMLDIIDESRNEDYPDDVLVYFFKEGLNPEGMWVRGEELKEGYFIGKLLNSPNQDFGLDINDEIKVFLQKDEEDNIFCIADLR